MNTLDRQKLDVVNQTRSNLFGRRGQLTPGFVAGRGLHAVCPQRIIRP